MSARENICFINNYNNDRFISDCLDSVIAQTHPFDRIIVVDDGSTDNSLELLASYKEKHVNLEVLAKSNGGQLSTFNFIVDLIPLDSQVFLLDGDDAYPPDYLELVLKEFNHQSWDFAFCERRDFYSINDESLKTARLSKIPSISFERSSALTRSRYCWIGNVTSTISISGEFFKKIFPFHIDESWVLPADDVVIYASSILGAHKTYLRSVTVGWRNHGSNHSLKEHSPQYRAKKGRDIEESFAYYCEKACLERYPSIPDFYAEYQALAKQAKVHLNLPNHWKILNRLVRQGYLGCKAKYSA
jgi:glycosyltransferase involved in cell wall biosynthesis